MGTKKANKNSRNWLSLFVIIFAFVLVYIIANATPSGQLIAISEAQTMVQKGEVSDIHVKAGMAVVRVVDSEVALNEFPSEYDYYFEYTNNDDLSFIEKWNDDQRQASNEDKIISYTKANPTASFIEIIAPYVSIVVMVIIGFMIFKLFSTKGGGAGSFNKSRAKIIEKSNVRFSDIAGAEEEKQEVAEIVEFLKNPAKFTALGARIPKGVLLVGPPGTGKTLLAKAVAGESNVPFLQISGSDFVELYVGVGAGRVRDLFETAKKNAPCIVFIDEIDAVGRQRGTGLGGGNDEKEQTLNQLLVEMDGFETNAGVIVLAATNRSDVLDPAILRPGRFDRQVYVNVPDVRGREKIIEIYVKNKPIDSSVNLTSIARLTSGFSGADIENMLNEAAIITARQGRLLITMEDITEGINKVLMGPKKSSRLVTENDRKLTAYHESGHAILSKLLDKDNEVHEVSIIPRGQAGGYTSTRPANDDNHYSVSKLNNRLCTIMGGRIAEEIIFKDITAGASSDISNATSIARKMITEWGMSKELGFLNFGSDNQLFIGRDYQTKVVYSEETAKQIDKEIREIVQTNYEKAKQLLVQHSDTLENMAQLLLEKETIYTQEIDEIMQGIDYKEIIKRIDKQEKARKRKEDKIRKEQQELEKKKIEELKIQAAKALNAAGVISDKELKVVLNNDQQDAQTTSTEKQTKENKDNKKQSKTDNKKDTNKQDK